MRDAGTCALQPSYVPSIVFGTQVSVPVSEIKATEDHLCLQVLFMSRRALYPIYVGMSSLVRTVGAYMWRIVSFIKFYLPFSFRFVSFSFFS